MWAQSRQVPVSAQVRVLVPELAQAQALVPESGQASAPVSAQAWVLALVQVSAWVQVSVKVQVLPTVPAQQRSWKSKAKRLCRNCLKVLAT